MLLNGTQKLVRLNAIRGVRRQEVSNELSLGQADNITMCAQHRTQHRRTTSLAPNYENG